MKHFENLESDEEDDLDKFEVNMDQGDNKKERYKRIYDSKYKIPLAKKLSAMS